MRARALAVAAALAALVAPVHAFAAASDDAPADYGAEARLLWRAAACGGSDALPARLPVKAIDANCKTLAAVYTRFNDKWVALASPFFAKLRPAVLPDEVVYPFGGGDLLYALVVFPDASTITSIALERAGDARRIDTISKADFKTGLADTTWMIEHLASDEYSFTEHMQEKQESELPVQLVMSLAALAALGYEPVNLRYFRIEDDGALHYFTADEIATAVGQEKKKKFAHIPEVFGNVELTFRKAGDASAPLRTYRSIAANLVDGKLDKDARVLAHLEKKGKVAAMVKAASYLLWRTDFHRMRDYLLGHVQWMVSDSTGILPTASLAAGFELEAWGEFKGSLLHTDAKLNRDMIKLWRDQPARELPFRFGYPDWQHKGGHLLVMARTDK